MKKESGLARGAQCAALLFLLAASGYLGASGNGQAAKVAVPVVFESIEAGAFLQAGIEEEKDRLGLEREKALLLLEEVIADSNAPKQTVQRALERKTQIASDMENEAKLEAALDSMGFSGMKAVCGEQALTVIAPGKTLLDAKARMQIVDAAASIAGVSPECVKIILAKNE